MKTTNKQREKFDIKQVREHRTLEGSVFEIAAVRVPGNHCGSCYSENSSGFLNIDI